MNNVTSNLGLPGRPRFSAFVSLSLAAGRAGRVGGLYGASGRFHRLGTSTGFSFLPGTGHGFRPAIFCGLPFHVMQFGVARGACRAIVAGLSTRGFPTARLGGLCTVH